MLQDLLFLLALTVKTIRRGHCISARLEPWHGAEETPITNGWKEENNGGDGNYNKQGRERELHEEHMEQQMKEGIERMRQEILDDVHTEDDPSRRRLGGGQSCGFGSDYTFEFAINGEVKASLSKGEFCQRFTRLNYNLDVFKFMDDKDFSGDVELAMRMTNCGRGAVMCISHLYWA